MKKILSVLTILLFAVCSSAFVFASTPDEMIADQIATLKKQMEEMQAKLKDLESQLNKAKSDTAAAQQQTEAVQQQMETKLAEVSNVNKVVDDLAKKFSWLKFGGYIRSRYWWGDHQQSSFDVTEIAFNVRYDVSENISGEFHLWFHPSGNAASGAGLSNYGNWAGPTTFFESAYAEFRKLNIGPVNGTLQVGKFRDFALGIAPTGTDRVYSDYGLFHQSMTQSRITGSQYFATYQRFKANLAVFNGWAFADTNRFGAKPAGIRFLSDSQENVDDNYDKAVSMRLAYRVLNELEVGFSGFRQELSASDLAAFNEIMGKNPAMYGPTVKLSKAREQWRSGFDLEYKHDPFHFQNEYFFGEVSDVRCNWWYVMGGLKFPRYKVDLYLKYSQANYDTQRVADIRASGAWDKRELAPLLIYTIHPQAKLFFEYYLLETENPNGFNAHIGNNYGFVELILFY